MSEQIMQNTIELQHQIGRKNAQKLLNILKSDAQNTASINNLTQIEVGSILLDIIKNGITKSKLFEIERYIAFDSRFDYIEQDTSLHIKNLRKIVDQENL